MVRSYRFTINKEDDFIDLSSKIITTKKQNLIHQLIKVLRYPEHEARNNIELIVKNENFELMLRKLCELGNYEGSLSFNWTRRWYEYRRSGGFRKARF